LFSKNYNIVLSQFIPANPSNQSIMLPFSGLRNNLARGRALVSTAPVFRHNASSRLLHCYWLRKTGKLAH